MTSHELAKKLLEGPDLPVAVNDSGGIKTLVTRIFQTRGPVDVLQENTEYQETEMEYICPSF